MMGKEATLRASQKEGSIKDYFLSYGYPALAVEKNFLLPLKKSIDRIRVEIILDSQCGSH